MTAGLQADSFALNDRLGRAVVTLATALDDVVALNTMLNDGRRFNGSTGLQAAPLAYSSSDAGLIVAAYSDMANLAAVAHGQAGFQVQIGAGPLGASDFFFNARLLMGVQPL